MHTAFPSPKGDQIIGANLWQNCSIDEESMKFSAQVL
jgi:hypothetical protein